MNERYTKLFSLQNNLYAEGSPVIIAAGALLKDNSTSTVLAQLKFQNISKTSVKALTVKIAASDTLGNRIGDMIEYQYLDLSAVRNNYFGQKTPIKLPDNKTRSFSVRVTEVIFSDNTVWTSNNNQWEPLKVQINLEDALGDMQLAKQYRIQYGSSCIYMPTKEKDLWICACGTINHNNESRCCKCGNTADTIFSVDMDKLKADCDERVEMEKKKAEEAERKIKQSMKRGALITVILIVCIVIISILGNYIYKEITYRHSIKLMESGQCKKAIEIFNSLGNYKHEKIDGVLYIDKYLIKADSTIDTCNIKAGTTAINNEAFRECKNLTSVTIPDSVTTIGDSAFWGCKKLTNITIPDSVTNIGITAFEYCSNLTTIVIPDSVINIGNYAFAYCDCLSDITISNNIKSINYGVFLGCKQLKNVIIPDSVTSINKSAFEYCNGLISVVIPRSVTKIKDQAFNCDQFTIKYTGSIEDWQAVDIGKHNGYLKNAEIIYNYVGE